MMLLIRIDIILLLSRTLYGEKAMELPERTNEMTGLYAAQCIDLAKELGVRSIDLWSKMQETENWQKKFLRLVLLESKLWLSISKYHRNFFKFITTAMYWNFLFLFMCFFFGCFVICSDGLHLTEKGNAVVYEEVVRVFSETWLSASEMPYDFPPHSEIDPKNPAKAFEEHCL